MSRRETASTVAKVFANLLSRPLGELSASSHFFDLGGDSMGAGKMLNALRKEYPLRLLRGAQATVDGARVGGVAAGG